jgi:hypothetical protein
MAFLANSLHAMTYLRRYCGGRSTYPKQDVNVAESFAAAEDRTS